MQEKEINRHQNTDFTDLTYLRRSNFLTKAADCNVINSRMGKVVDISINKIKKAPEAPNYILLLI